MHYPGHTNQKRPFLDPPGGPPGGSKMTLFGGPAAGWETHTDSLIVCCVWSYRKSSYLDYVYINKSSFIVSLYRAVGP